MKKDNGLSMFLRGIYASFPIAIGYLPVAMLFGVTAVGYGLGYFFSFLCSVLIFAGTSQFVLLSFLSQSILLAIFLPIFLNLRHLVYSSIVSASLPLKKPFLAAFGLTDEVFALFLSSPRNEMFLLGLEVGAYLSWVAGTLLGILAGSFVLKIKCMMPSLTFSLTALFFLLVLLNLKKDNLLYAILGGMLSLIFHFFGLSAIGILVSGILVPLIPFKGRG
ncbi:AzlC family ABC transporter permease [Thermodesulfatator atlanticus]